MGFWEEAGKVFLRSRASATQNKDTMQRLNLHAQNQGQQLWLQHVAKGYGLDPSAQPFLKPYGVEPDVNVTNNNMPQSQDQPKSNALPWIAGLLLGATGLGAAGGALYAVKGSGAIPTAPQNFKIKVGFDEEKGFQFGQPEQVK